MSLASDLPSTQIFDKIAPKLDSSESAKQQAIEDINGVHAFHLTGDGGGEWFVDVKESGQVGRGEWFVDVKESGQVGRGEVPKGKKADVTMTLAAEDFQKVVDDKNAIMQLFFGGKLKVTGNQMLMTKVDKVFALGK
ncbi:hypothetical protein CBER1_10203 [Cercospora berteroae]|uniref:SCP2 domain-containing protein n=1 Tax=Cercospora berteroae TaxID=357750 RepID=A0A2S6CES1_9PEZI|nr:hypothetical protein CBER1_10203 [Cercospora berteroae]